MKHIANPGDLIAERFRVVRFIAEGGMGEVYEAEDSVLQENVALKFLNRRNIGNERVARRFRREILLARKVTHSNVCRLFDVFQHESESSRPVTFVTMELLDGDTLEEHLEKKGPLSEEEALPLVRQMAEGLAAAHAAGIIHRDFKASNVMLVPTEGLEGGFRTVITDFGLARSTARSGGSAHSPLTGEMHIVGTVDYMSPEQLMGEEVTTVSDIYAFGVVLFEMLTDQKPFKAANPVALLAKRVNDPAPRPREVNPDISELWDKVILKCLERDPEQRLTSGWDIIMALTGETASMGPTASGTIPRPASWMLEETETVPAPTTSPGIRSLGFASLLLLLSLLALFSFLRWQQQDHLPIDPWSKTPRQLTSGGGLEIDPAFSPDGQRIAYSSDREDGFHIWVTELGSDSQAVRVTQGEGQFFEPAWSSDGAHLAVHSRSRGGIWRVDAEGKRAAEPLTSFGSRPAISPDGRQLVFQSASSPLLSDTTAPALATSTLWVLDLDGDPPRPVGRPSQLTRVGEPAGGHGAPSWSPDGRFVVFSASTYGRSSLWGIEIETQRVYALPSDELGAKGLQNVYDPIYSTDGHSVYFSGGSRHVNGLWWVPVSADEGTATGPPRQIRNLGLASIRQLTLSPDGERIAYLAMHTGSELWQQPLDPATALPVGQAAPLTQGGGRNNRPAFSHDGAFVAFDHWQLGDDIDVWALNLASREVQQITAQPSSDSQGQWLPDDQALTFHSSRDGERALWHVGIDASTSEQTQLLELPSDVYWTALSPEGSQIAYHSAADGGLALWSRSLDGGEPLMLVSLDDLQGSGTTDLRNEAFLGFPCWSPDGQWLAFQFKRGKNDTQVMLIGQNGRGLRQLTDVEGENWPYSFSADGDKIAFAAQRNGEWNLFWVSRSSGVEQRLIPSPMLHQYVRYPTFSPQGDRLVYELAQSTGDIFIVEQGDS